MISLYSFNVFDGFSKSILSASQFIKKIEKATYATFFKELNSSSPLKKQKVVGRSSYVPILVGSAAVISAVAAFFYCQKAGIPVDQMVNKVLSKGDCASLLKASNRSVDFIEKNLESIRFCQDTYS